MIRVYGHIKDNPNQIFIKHKKLIPHFSYKDGFDFEIFLDYDNIDEDHMPLEGSKNLIIQAINKKYNVDFHGTTSFINPLRIQKELSDDKSLYNKVGDKIFKYQYNQAHELLNKEYFLGAACVFGVALERICLLILKKHNVKVNKTEIGNLAYLMGNKNIISPQDKQRILGGALFRNLSSHTNGYSLKLDAENIRDLIIYLVETYF